ncbi:MAG: hypoxanthine-guanine phosphoribosyltransferase, partial [Trichlorobacter sp.]
MDRLEALRMMQEAECLVDRQAVGQALDRMAAAICHDLSETFPMVLTVMNGGMVVSGELLLRLAFP